MACRPLPNLCFANPRPARPNPNKHTQRKTHSLHPECFTEAERHRSQTQKAAAASEEAEEEGGGVRRRAWEHPLLSAVSEPHLVVDDHHVVGVRAQPRVHGLADAADLVQGRSVVVGPAKVQHLRDQRRLSVRITVEQYARGEERRDWADGFTFGLSWLMSYRFSLRLKSWRRRRRKNKANYYRFFRHYCAMTEKKTRLLIIDQLYQETQ